MANLTPESWTETDDFREIVKPSQQADFLERIAEAHREGKVVNSVMVMNGVPVLYNISDPK